MSLCLQLRMEAGEETSGSINLKRQRAPLSDSEDNVVSSSGWGCFMYSKQCEGSHISNLVMSIHLQQLWIMDMMTFVSIFLV